MSDHTVSHTLAHIACRMALNSWTHALENSPELAELPPESLNIVRAAVASAAETARAELSHFFGPLPEWALGPMPKAPAVEPPDMA